MIEPWVTPWSRFVYTYLHHEPFEPEAQSWEFPSAGPLSGANSALPWIVFSRDREQFIREFPLLGLESIKPAMPFLYLLSGGVSMRSLQPGWTFPLWRSFDSTWNACFPGMAMFARIVLKRMRNKVTG